MSKSTNSSKTDYKKGGTENHSSFKAEFSQLNEDLQTIIQHVKKSGSTFAKEAGHDIAEKVENIAVRMSGLNDQISGAASDFFKTQMAKTKERTDEYTADLETAVKEHPLSSLAISFGVGLIIAKVLWPCQSSH